MNRSCRRELSVVENVVGKELRIEWVAEKRPIYELFKRRRTHRHTVSAVDRSLLRPFIDSNTTASNTRSSSLQDFAWSRETLDTAGSAIQSSNSSLDIHDSARYAPKNTFDIPDSIVTNADLTYDDELDKRLTDSQEDDDLNIYSGSSQRNAPSLRPLRAFQRWIRLAYIKYFEK